VTLLAINIRKLRKKYKITQDQLAAHCGVSGAAVSQWESKANPTIPDVVNLLLVAQLLNSSVEQLMRAENIEIDSGDDHELNTRLLNRVFAAIDQTKVMKERFASGSITRQSHLFKALYTIYKDLALDESLSDDNLLILIGLKETDSIN